MKVFEHANAKVNLYLDVSSKREDGYHNVTTFMHQITLCDDLWIEAADAEKTDIQLTIDGGKDIPSDGRNLVYKAIVLFLSEIGRTMNVGVKLKKRIPSMAGLGGGSSDAAAALRGMNKMLNFPLPDEKLEELAAQIGSDVPFFIRNISALCLGRGEILKKITPILQSHVVLVEGKEPSSTKDAFAKLDTEKRAERKHPDFAQFAFDDAFNIFENIIAEDCPSVAEHLSILKQQDPLCTLMSGSGSAVFALFDDEAKAHIAAESIMRSGSVAHVCQLVQS